MKTEKKNETNVTRFGHTNNNGIRRREKENEQWKEKKKNMKRIPNENDEWSLFSFA